MNFFRDKQFVKFLLISFLLICSAIGMAFISAAAAQMGDYEMASLTSKIALGLSVGIMVYVVPRLARNVRLEYLQSGLAMNVMSAGWLFCAFILIVAIAAVSTGNNLLYMVLASLMATMVLSGVASRLSIGNVSVALRFPDHIFAGDPTHLEVTLNNEKRLLPSFSLTVAATDQPNRKALKKTKKTAGVNEQSLGDLAFFPILPAKTKAKIRVIRTFDKRGVYPVRGFMVRTRFPFGFVERRRFVEASGEVIVYPRPQALDDSYHLLPLTHGQMESELKGTGSDLYAIRKYVPSDHPRYVDWKATAKTTRLMVREFTRDDDWRVTIALDAFDIGQAVSPPEAEAGKEKPPNFNDQFERAVTFAASLLTHFLDEGAEVRMILNDYDSAFGRDNDHRYEMLRQLAKIAPLTPTPTEQTKKAEKPKSDLAAWNLLERMPTLADDEFKILITPAVRGSIPASIWRSAHVVYFDDL